jgi:hypothetical protein
VGAVYSPQPDFKVPQTSATSEKTHSGEKSNKRKESGGALQSLSKVALEHFFCLQTERIVPDETIDFKVSQTSATNQCENAQWRKAKLHTD